MESHTNLPRSTEFTFTEKAPVVSFAGVRRVPLVIFMGVSGGMGRGPQENPDQIRKGGELPPFNLFSVPLPVFHDGRGDTRFLCLLLPGVLYAIFLLEEFQTGHRVQGIDEDVLHPVRYPLEGLLRLWQLGLQYVAGARVNGLIAALITF